MLSDVYRSLSEHSVSVLLEIEEVMITVKIYSAITENATDFVRANRLWSFSVVSLSDSCPAHTYTNIDLLLDLQLDLQEYLEAGMLRKESVERLHFTHKSLYNIQPFCLAILQR